MLRKTVETTLDVSGTAPLYKQVENRILQCLADGEWRPGEQLPTESQLAARFKVAVFTIRAGISELVKSNILIRKQGKGTFVARHSLQRQRYQFSRVYDSSGSQIFPDRSLIAFAKERVTPHVAGMLALQGPHDLSMLHLQCLLSIGAEPASIMEIMLPAGMFKKLTARAVREAKENLYAVYQDVCGINVIRVEERIHAALVEQPVAGQLKLRAGAPVLRIERIAYTYKNIPVEYRVRHFDASRFHYRIDEGGV
jgi:GntR family transcriptional regulator